MEFNSDNCTTIVTAERILNEYDDDDPNIGT